MASTQDLKRRVRSVQNTQKITKAFELVASARLRRAQARIETMRPYADKMLELMSGVARASVSKQRLPLLQRREPQTTAILLMTGDRGLAGAFNSQVLRRAFALGRELEGEGQTVRWLVAGKKGRSTLRFRGYEVASDWTGFSDRPGVHGRAGDRAHAHRAVRRGRVRSRDPGLQPLRLAARAEGDRAGGAADPGAPARDRRRRAPRRRDARRLHLRARARGDPRAAVARLPRDGALPRAARVGGLRAGRPDDRDAERVEERRRADRQPHARDEPRPPGRDHPGDPGSRRRRRRAGRARPPTFSAEAPS